MQFETHTGCASISRGATTNPRWNLPPLGNPVLFPSSPSQPHLPVPTYSRFCTAMRPSLIKFNNFCTARASLSSDAVDETALFSSLLLYLSRPAPILVSLFLIVCLSISLLPSCLRSIYFLPCGLRHVINLHLSQRNHWVPQIYDDDMPDLLKQPLDLPATPFSTVSSTSIRDFSLFISVRLASREFHR